VSVAHADHTRSRLYVRVWHTQQAAEYAWHNLHSFVVVRPTHFTQGVGLCLFPPVCILGEAVGWLRTSCLELLWCHP